MTAEIRIPARVDDPPHLIIWSMDELMPIVFGFLIGLFIDQKLIFTGVGWLVSKAYVRFRDTHPNGYILHMIYSWGFWPSRTKLLPNPYIQRFFP